MTQPPASIAGSDPSKCVGKPRLLDLFCGAGGAAMGYHRAGFEVIGFDIAYQANYPFAFAPRDALSVLEDLAAGLNKGRVAAVHASPPCQFYSAMSTCRPGLADEYEELITPTRELLDEIGLPYVIENVERAQRFMRDPVTLCAFAFGRELYRHRLFEANWPLTVPEHREHTIPASKAGHWKPGTIMSVAGHVAPVAHARKIMEIDWTTREELVEAIPPYFSEYVGAQLLAEVGRRDEVAA